MMMTLQRHICLVMAVLSLCLAAQEPAVRPDYSYPFQGVLTGDKVALHSRPTVNSETLDYLRKGQQLQVVGVRGDWFRVQLPRTVNLWLETAAVDADGLLRRPAVMYVGPSSIFSDLGQLRQGTRVERVVQTSPDGRPLQTPDGNPRFRVQDGFIAILAPEEAHGWLYARYLAPVHPQAVTKAVAAPPQPTQPQQTTLEKQLETEAASLKADRERLRQLEADAAKLRDERTRMEANLANLRQDMQELERQKEAASLKAAQVRAEREEQERKAREELQRLEAESKEAADRRNAVQGENAALVSAARQKELEVKAAQAELKRLEAEASAEKARVAAESAEQKVAFDAAKAKLAQAEAERLQLVQRQEQLTKSVAQLENAKQATESYLIALQKEQNRLEQTKKSEEASVAGLKEEIERLSKEKTQMRQQADMAQKELELLSETAKAEAEKLAQQRQQHEADAQAAREQADAQAKAAQLAIDNAKRDMAAAEAEQLKLQQQLADAKAASLLAAQEAEKLRLEREQLEAQNRADAEKLAQERERLEAQKKADADKLAQEREQLAAQQKAETERLAEERRKAAERKAAEEAALAAAEPEMLPVQLFTGEVLPLRNGGNELASHALCVRRNQGYAIVCYLQSPQLDLNAWARRDLVVTVEGELVQPHGWKHPLLKVQSIMRRR